MWPPSSICPFSSGPFSEWRRPQPKAVVPRVCLLPHPSLGPSAPRGGPPHPEAASGPSRSPETRPAAGLPPSPFPVVSGAQHLQCLRLHQERSSPESDRGIFSFLKPISCQHWLLNLLCPLVLWHLGDILAETSACHYGQKTRAP